MCDYNGIMLGINILKLYKVCKFMRLSNVLLNSNRVTKESRRKLKEFNKKTYQNPWDTIKQFQEIFTVLNADVKNVDTKYYNVMNHFKAL